MASLDQLRGYAQNHFGEVRQFASTEYVQQAQAGGYQVLREPLWNKGAPRPRPRPSLPSRGFRG